MTDSGNLSIDFLVGFTIFLMAFIWVATMIPGLLIGLQANSIDYTAVAYRTGVILVEDPGWPASPPWESYADFAKSNVSRFGLAISKETPNILSDDKVNRFFCLSTTDPSVGFVYPDDYRSRAIFGDVRYNFNISLRDTDANLTRMIGSVLPKNYGYIRRVVKIKSISNATIDQRKIALFHYNNTDGNVTRHEFSILFNNTKLLGDVTNPLYQIDPARERTIVNITDWKYFMSANPATTTVTLMNVTIYKLDPSGLSSFAGISPNQFVYTDGNRSRVDQLPIVVNNNISIQLSPYLFTQINAQYAKVFINLTFNLTTPSTFINTTNNPNASPFDYNYYSDNVTQPRLRDAVVEVAVW